MTEDTQVLSTTETTLRLVEALKTAGGRTVPDLAEELDLAESTVYKHLYTLKKHSFVVQSGDHYRLSLRFLNLGGFARHSEPEYQVADTILQSMSEEDIPYWSVDFGIINNNRHLTVAFISDEFDAYPGQYYYLHTVSGGKAIMSELPERRIDDIIDQWGLPQLTEKTITSREELLEDLERTRERGYAVGDEEWLEGMRGVAKSIKYPTGEVLGAFAIAGPIYMLKDDVLTDEVPETLSKHVELFESRLEDAMLGASQK